MASLIVRADATRRMGSGHVLRCLALAEAWQARGGAVTFLSYCESAALRQRIEAAGCAFQPLTAAYPQGEELSETLRFLAAPAAGPGEWLVVDGYHFDGAYQQAVRRSGYRLLIIDDMAHLPRYHADVLLNQNVTASHLAYRCDPDSLLLLGTSYALLRTEFQPWAARPRTVRREARNVLVTMGGSDPDNVTQRVLQALQRAELADVAVRVVVGPANPHIDSVRDAVRRCGSAAEILANVTDMPAQMAWADIAVTAGGSTCWELACMGLPSIVLAVADNQRAIAQALDACGAFVYLGDAAEASLQQISSSLRALVRDGAKREHMSALGRVLVDGQGATRVADRLEATNRSNARALPAAIRRVGPGDAFLLWQWANDPTVRSNSFDRRPIPWPSHVQWLQGKVVAAGTAMWIMEWQGVPVGQVRYDRIERGMAAVNYTIVAGYRGRGLGTELLKISGPLACEILGVTRLQAMTLVDNAASGRALEKAGYIRIATKEDALVFVREC